jgi:hypothetical protein
MSGDPPDGTTNPSSAAGKPTALAADNGHTGFPQARKERPQRTPHHRRKPSRRYTGVRGIKPSLNSAVKGRRSW